MATTPEATNLYDEEPITEVEAREQTDEWIVGRNVGQQRLHLPAGAEGTDTRCGDDIVGARRVDVDVYPEGYLNVCAHCRLAIKVNGTDPFQDLKVVTCRVCGGTIKDGVCGFCEEIDASPDSGRRNRKPFSNDHPLADEVAAHVRRLWAEGRAEFRANEIADEIDGYDARGVGMALSVLADAGWLEKIGGQTPYRWRIQK